MAHPSVPHVDLHCCVEYIFLANDDRSSKRARTRKTNVLAGCSEGDSDVEPSSLLPESQGSMPEKEISHLAILRRDAHSPLAAEAMPRNAEEDSVYIRAFILDQEINLAAEGDFFKSCPMLATRSHTGATGSREVDFRRRHTARLCYIIARRVTGYVMGSSSKRISTERQSNNASAKLPCEESPHNDISSRMWNSLYYNGSYSS